MSSLTSQQLSILSISNLIPNTFSLIGELLMIISYLWIPAMRTLTMKLIISLVFTDLCYTLINFLSFFSSDPTICNLEAFVRVWAVLAGPLWMLSIIGCAYYQYTKKLIDRTRGY